MMIKLIQSNIMFILNQYIICLMIIYRLQKKGLVKLYTFKYLLGAWMCMVLTFNVSILKHQGCIFIFFNCNSKTLIALKIINVSTFGQHRYSDCSPNIAVA